ncbi:AraC family transcriptional regulator [Flagellimonas myxillae]|uniref:AraC family transcriptional regulator n=1 Tax=Flagellimonas myxillae TaxID=2942214 RepID=UPI00201E7E56|nr:AraC family transcriptional regulator [Muricauda myxillae]MCL6266147.1 AraC family transcriptional regulator [Muricauda myxillae]
MKIYSFTIPKKPGENIVVQNDEGPAFFDKLHQHREIQLSLILKGTGKVIVGDSVHVFHPGDFFVIGSHIPHLFKSEVTDGIVQMKSVFFAMDSFGASFFQLQEMEELKYFFNYAETGFKLNTTSLEIPMVIERIFSQTHFARFMMLMQLLRMLSGAQKLPLSNFLEPKELSHDHGERLRVVFDYVMENFEQKITLEKVSKLAHMTPNAFCRFFKQRTNKTFFKFLSEIRIEHVCQLLAQNQDLSVVEAAHQAGFNSISNFNKTFKDIKGTNPTKYLKELS